MLPLASWHRGFAPRRQCTSLGALHVRRDPGPGDGSDRQAVSEDRRPQRHGHRAASDQRADRTAKLPEVRAGYGAQYSIDRRHGDAPASAGREPGRDTHVELDAPVVRVSRNRDESYSVGVRRRQTRRAAGVRCRRRRAAVQPAAGHRMGRRAAAPRDGDACRALRSARALPAHLDPLRPAVLAAPDRRFVGHARCVRRLLRLRRSVPHTRLAGYGVLGWLLAGADALSLVQRRRSHARSRARSNRCPTSSTTEARRRFIEGKVHRWAGAVSGHPGGFPVRDPFAAHQPEPVEHPGLVVVGDYSVRLDAERRASFGADRDRTGSRPAARAALPARGVVTRHRSAVCRSSVEVAAVRRSPRLTTFRRPS